MLEVMSKLWIVHRSPQQRASLARLSGLAESDFEEGAPTDARFASAKSPAALVLGLDGDFELELDFVHRHRARLAETRWLLIAEPGDGDEAERLFSSLIGSLEAEIQPAPLSARPLRAFLTRALSHRNALGLAERQHRQRISERFSLWLDGIEVPGLLRVLDPSLANLPLLVRGVPGSGRSLLCHYVEIFRGARGGILRLHGQDLNSPGALRRQIRARVAQDEGPDGRQGAARGLRSVWIDEIDLLPISVQRELAELILHGGADLDFDAGSLRWIATAAPLGQGNELESSLEHALAPLSIEVPSLRTHPEILASFASEVAKEWTRSVGGVDRAFGDSALVMLEAHPWSNDRAELEAVLRTSLAASSRERLEDVDLRFPTDLAPWASDSSFAQTGQRDGQGESGSSEPQPDEARSADTIDTLIEGRDANEGGPVAMTAVLTDEADALSPADFADDQNAGEIPLAVFVDELDRDSAEPGNPDADESTSLAEAAFDLAREPSNAKPASEAPEAEGGLGWRRLARSLSHEIRNPLVSIRTFAELLPEHFEDETFRERFTELVGRDVAHISNVLTRLSNISDREKFEAEPVDVSALIEELLEERRERIARGRLLVLRELERDAPLAWADSRGLQVALAGLLDRALEALPERGDLFVATRHLERGADGLSKLRILLRHHNPNATQSGDAGLGELDPTSNILEYVLAETVVSASGGTLTIDATDAQETLILVDLQTPI